MQVISFAKILKKDMYHDARGRFSTAPDHAGIAATEWSKEHIQRELDHLGIAHHYDSDTWHKVMMGVTPLKFFTAFFGNPSKETLKNLEGAISYEGIAFKAEDTEVHGQPTQMYGRQLNLKLGEAKHHMLEFADSARGGGIAKKVLKDSIALYDRLNISKVRLMAALELGAYTWAKFGFRMDNNTHAEGHAQEVFDNLEKELNRDRHVDNMTPEEKHEVMAIGKLLDVDRHDGIDYTRNNQLLANMKTPHLDKRYAARIMHTFPEKGTFMKHLMYTTSYDATLHLNDAAQMKVFHDYANK